jgi:hypothetical protein
MSQRDAAKKMGIALSTLHDNLIAGKERLKEILPALMSPSLRKHYIPNAPASYPVEADMPPLLELSCWKPGSH